MKTNEYNTLPSPCFLLEESRLRKNLQLINHVQQKSGCKIILALKGFAMWSVFPLIRKYLEGCAASSYNEARLAHDHFGGHLHLYSPAYRDDEFNDLMKISDRISFNSLSQWQLFSKRALKAGISCGLRVNPQINEVETALYNPSGAQSRLGISEEELKILPEGIEGLHVHALCENDADSTARLLEAVEKRFGHLLGKLKWLNLGGGHLMTRKGYDTSLLIKTLSSFKQRHPWLEIVLEPGSAIAWDTGPLISTVLDIIQRDGINMAILDTSATAHMPDVLEMPYRPAVRHAVEAGKNNIEYRLCGLSCLAGDIIGDYAFENKLQVGDKIIFEDMMHYTMVKTTMFNGLNHPAIAIQREDESIDVTRCFEYKDYEARLS
ncbi:MAG: carboxynorspermidine decarboxylase [Gammaproteobacteria bacterium]|jgi:carboxynorspermidine decarboxylase